jgi:tetratricopeptide (TPR) repeat protein
VQQAAAHHKEAGDLLAAGKYVEAAKKYLEAYAKSANPNELFNAARAEQVRGRHKEAVKLFKTYLSLPETDRVAAEHRQEASKLVAESESKLCKIDVRAREAWVDGEKASGVVIAAPGEHEVLMNEDAGPKTKKVTCRVGEVTMVAYDETAAKGAGEPKVPITPPPKVETETGSWLVPGVLAGVGLVGVGVGVGLGLASISAEKEASDQSVACRGGSPAACETVRSADGRASSLATGAVFGQVGGALFLGGAVVATLVIRPWEPRPKVKVSVAPTLGGAAVLGTF